MAIVLLVGIFEVQLKAQTTTEVAWQRCLGGSDVELPSNLRPTSDGGFICVGWGISTDGDLTGNHGSSDILATKLNGDGTVQWSRVLGGSGDELSFDCMEASDGSIMITGNSTSIDGDVTSNQGGQDLWVLKLSPLGDIIWQRTYGGTGTELGGQIHETSDGGFVLQLTTNSNDGDVVGYHPGPEAQDHWVLKIDPAGNVLWSRALGGGGADAGIGMAPTADGGVLVMLITTSIDGDIMNAYGGDDCVLIKLSFTGVVEWSRTVGGGQRDYGLSVLELGNGDIMLMGMTLSNDGDVAVNQGAYDIFLAKITSSGSLVWLRTYGGTLNDTGQNLLATADGGSLIAAVSRSNDGDLSNNQGESDAWVIKVDANGALVWQRTFGGTLADGCSARKADGGGFLLSGFTFSNDGDVQGHHGENDVWLVKISENGELLWQRCLGGSSYESGVVRAQAPDGGYVAFGRTNSNDGDVSGNHGQNDMWVVKLNVNDPNDPIDPIEPLECALFVPNAFSPNNSAKNDAHCIYGTDCVTSMTFNIYDRWGNTVFESSDPSACWDGTYNGQALDPAVFVYHLSATLANGEVVKKQGNITLVR
jgi:gliding motility-associated-like protein